MQRLAITGAIRGSSREKLYRELGFESLHDRRWYRKLCFYYKILHADCPSYLSELIPVLSHFPPPPFLTLTLTLTIWFRVRVKNGGGGKMGKYPYSYCGTQLL